MGLLKIRRLSMNGLSHQNFMIRSLRKFSFSSIHLLQNHYEVLGLSQSCSQQEIKEAFFKKSKELHPDKNLQSQQNHNLIVAVNEAYSVLGKTASREIYDHHLRMNKYSPRGYNPRYEMDDDFIWMYQGRAQWQNSPLRNKRVNKFPNSYVVTGIILFTVIGSYLYFSLATFAASYNRKQMDHNDMLVTHAYLHVRKKALTNGNDVQMRLLREEDQRRRNSEAD